MDVEEGIDVMGEKDRGGDERVEGMEESMKGREENKVIEGKLEELRKRGRPSNVERLGRERSGSCDGRMMSENIEAFLKRKREINLEGEGVGLRWQRCSKKVAMTKERDDGCEGEKIRVRRWGI